MLKPGGSPHPPHTHKNEELIIVKEGAVEAYVNGEWKPAPTGSLIFFASMVPHTVRNTGHGAGAVPRRQLGGARDQAEEGGREVSARDRVALASAGAALAAALGIGPRAAGLRAREQAAPAAPAAPVNNAPPAAVGPAVGYFEATADLGAPAIKGSTAYDAATQTYTLSAGGTNMWAARDEFQFAWRKMSGDFLIRTHVKFVGAGTDPHRKIGVIIRKGLEADSPYVDATVHGDGLTSLQHRQVAGGPTATISAAITHADVIELKREGRRYIMGVAKFGEPMVHTEFYGPDLGPDVHVGLFACSHNAEGEGDGDVHQRPHRRAAQDRLGAVPRLHRQQPRGAWTSRPGTAPCCTRRRSRSRRRTGPTTARR